MLGFVFGLACLWGLWRMIRHGRLRRRGRHRRVLLRGLLERLDATPGQEMVIRDALDETVDAVKDVLFGAREEVAHTLRSDRFDEVMMADLLTRYDEARDGLRETVVGSLAKIHQVLDADQRAELARWLWRRPSWAGPYRSHA